MPLPLTRFLHNVVQKGALTQDQAEVVNQLPTPHLQFEAVTRFRYCPTADLATIVEQVQMEANPPEGTRPAFRLGFQLEIRPAFGFLVIAAALIYPVLRFVTLHP